MSKSLNFQPNRGENSHTGVPQVVVREQLNANDGKTVVQQQDHYGDAETVMLPWQW